MWDTLNPMTNLYGECKNDLFDEIYHNFILEGIQLGDENKDVVIFDIIFKDKLIIFYNEEEEYIYQLYDIKYIYASDNSINTLELFLL